MPTALTRSTEKKSPTLSGSKVTSSRSPLSLRRSRLALQAESSMFPARPAESEKINLEDMNSEKNLTATGPHKARANRLISSNLWRWLADSKASPKLTTFTLRLLSCIFINLVNLLVFLVLVVFVHKRLQREDTAWRISSETDTDATRLRYITEQIISQTLTAQGSVLNIRHNWFSSAFPMSLIDVVTAWCRLVEEFEDRQISYLSASEFTLVLHTGI
ncbi:hypothetical protein RRG08_046373 [Elysia crispata]|uniref:Uncharacterized protein n=1 Tax=Elysia crispata TaxID=231223 RepID=A0AAE1AX48_9GAST|nr:hypothetical protein RRG08_046373 [Elysia crispata]